MYVTYFDEVKPNPRQGQDCYWIGGVSVPIDAIAEVEDELAELAEDTFGSSDLTPNTEFHCKEIYSRKGQFKGVEIVDRIDLLVDLIDIIRRHDAIKRVMACVDTSLLLSRQNVAAIAFAFFCERVQMLVKDMGQKTILIGDQNDEGKAMIREFSRYRATKTMWEYGIKIEDIVDTVHFAHSHHSRMLQLADVYMFYLTHMATPPCRKGWMADELRKRLKGMGLIPNRYKIWPQQRR